mmetsp:Transcript_3254/g.8169  ORF Transcript_3254/g.8169 Transcript_3254/m.8169 type:complete len:440 (+) Transcript_3254:37-1356(+)
MSAAVAEAPKASAKRAREEVDSLQRLEPAVQHYAWGMTGGKGLVAEMSGKAELDKPYAELWMGTHPSAPSKVKEEGGGSKDLSAFLEQYPAFAGGKIGQQLPYLFKCLSVRCPLSIQAHPNKSLAEQLHAKDPKNYKDDNHKPELACAVSVFEGLCGFRPLEEISKHMSEVPELAAIVGKEAASGVTAAVGGSGDEQSKALQAAFAALMLADEGKVKEEAERLIERLKKTPEGDRTVADVVALSANDEFPGDVGLLSIYMLNIVKLQPGSAMFLKPNFPHAYLKGDCVELMATSDNVVRAGFTPKFKDVSTLVTMLEYNPTSPELVEGKSEGPNVCMYAPSGTEFPEFALRRVVLGDDSKDAYLCTSSCPRVILCVSGGAKAKTSPAKKDEDTGVKTSEMGMKPGDVVVCAADAVLEFSHTEGAGETLVFVSCCHPCFE